MLLIDIRSTNASAAEFILYRLKLYLAGRHHHHHVAYYVVGILPSNLALKTGWLHVSLHHSSWPAIDADLSSLSTALLDLVDLAVFQASPYAYPLKIPPFTSTDEHQARP